MLLGEHALEKKARSPRLFDVGELASYTDFILILTATSERHARALADHMARSTREQRIRPLGVEGYENGQWILLDYGDVIVHLLLEQAREYYDLDGLWIDAKQIPVRDPG